MPGRRRGVGPTDPWRPCVFRATAVARAPPVPGLQHHPVPAGLAGLAAGPAARRWPAQTGAAEELLQVLSDRGACFMSDLISRTRPPAIGRGGGPVVAGGQRAGYVGQRGPAAGARQRETGPCQAGSEAPRPGAAPSRHPPGINPQTLGPTALNPTAPPPDVPTPGWVRQVVAAGSPGPRWRIPWNSRPCNCYGGTGWFSLGNCWPGSEWLHAGGTWCESNHRRLEARGEIPGRAVCGWFRRRAVRPARRRDHAPGDPSLPGLVGKNGMDVVSACDPLNLVGIVTPGERVPALPGNRVVFRDGAPLASLEKGVLVNRGQRRRRDHFRRFCSVVRGGPAPRS